MSTFASINALLADLPLFMLVLVRLGAMMLYAPVLGNARVPKRVKALLAAMLALGMTRMLPLPRGLPDTAWGLAAAMGTEILLGLAMGTAVSNVFVAAQWAGDMIGQQMGLNLGEILDPQFGGSSSVVGDLYFLLTTAIFLVIGGHLAIVQGVRDSFAALPAGTATLRLDVLHLLAEFVLAATKLAMALAAPILVTMLVVDLAMGLIGRAMPQFNVQSAGTSVRSIVGMMILAAGTTLATSVLRQHVIDAINDAAHMCWAFRPA